MKVVFVFIHVRIVKIVTCTIKFMKKLLLFLLYSSLKGVSVVMYIFAFNFDDIS